MKTQTLTWWTEFLDTRTDLLGHTKLFVGTAIDLKMIRSSLQLISHIIFGKHTCEDYKAVTRNVSLQKHNKTKRETARIMKDRNQNGQLKDCCSYAHTSLAQTTPPVETGRLSELHPLPRRQARATIAQRRVANLVINNYRQQQALTSALPTIDSN